MHNCENYKPLLMGLIDHELTPEEITRINEHLIRCAECREEYEQLRQTATKIETISFIEPEDEILNSLWRSPYSRLTRFSGLFLVIAGWLALLLYALYELIRNNEEPFLPRIAVAAMTIGFLLLLIQLIRERLKTYSVDPYKEVKR
jgi:hypothetical protein